MKIIDIKMLMVVSLLQWWDLGGFFSIPINFFFLHLLLVTLKIRKARTILKHEIFIILKW